MVCARGVLISTRLRRDARDGKGIAEEPFGRSPVGDCCSRGQLGLQSTPRRGEWHQSPPLFEVNWTEPSRNGDAARAAVSTHPRDDHAQPPSTSRWTIARSFTSGNGGLVYGIPYS